MPNAFFKNKKLLPEKLLPFGFTRNKGAYTYATDIVEGQFRMSVIVTKNGQVDATVIDPESKGEYVLHRASGACGAFVNSVRTEYERVLGDISEKCFEADVFKSEHARKIIRYVRKIYNDELEFLWRRFPDNAIFRRRDNAKWYAALLTVKKEKLGLPGDGFLEVIDLRMTPEEIDVLVDGKRFFPGYHMNKKHWLTICLDGSVSVDEISPRIDASYALAAKKR
jgi:Uncharacterized protein conserved in bacteria